MRVVIEQNLKPVQSFVAKVTFFNKYYEWVIWGKTHEKELWIDFPLFYEEGERCLSREAETLGKMNFCPEKINMWLPTARPEMLSNK